MRQVTVDSPGDWPYPQEKLPAVCVRSSTETKSALNRGTDNFTTVIELDVRAAVCATTAEAAQDAIEALWYQIEQAILLDYYLLQLVQNVPTVESALEIKAQGQVHFAGIIGRFRFETFETFDAAQQAAAPAQPSVASAPAALTDVTIVVTRPESNPPYSSQSDDVGLTLTLPGD